MFSVEFSSQAKKFLKKMDKKLQLRIISKIEKLAEHPFPKKVKRVVNRKEKIFRIRVGSYRIQYGIFNDKNLLFVSDINKRPRAYLN